MADRTDIHPVEDGIRKQLDSLRRKEDSVRQASGALRFVLTVGAAWLVLMTFETILHAPPAVRTAAMVLFFTLLIVATGRMIVDPLLRRLGIVLRNSDDLHLAEMIGIKYPHVKDHIRNGLEIVEEHRRGRTHASTSLVDAALRDTAKELETIDVLSVVDYSVPVRLVKYGAGAIIVYILLFIIVPITLRDSTYRLLHFSESFAAPAAFSFDITPGDIEVVKGASVDVHVRMRGELKKEIDFMTQVPDRSQPERFVLRRDSSGVFVWHSPMLKTTFLYYAEAENVKSSTYTVTVIDRPVIKNLSIRLQPPSYSGLPAQTLDDNTGDITALSGTSVKLLLTLSKPVAKGVIVFDDSTRRELSVGGTSVRGTFVVNKNNRYHIELEDERGIHNVDPITYSIQALQDLPPEIAITVPGRNIDLNDQTHLAVLLNLHDDYGISRLRLRYRLSQSKYEKPREEYATINIPLPVTHAGQGGIDLSVPYQWDLAPLNMAAEDVVSYYAEVFDNNTVSGPSMARSSEFTIRYPSIDEMFTDADKEHQESVNDLQKSLKQAEELHKSLDEINQDLKKNPQIDWQQQQKLEETMKRYENLRKDVQSTARKADSLLQSVQNKNILSPETMEKYMEMQKLLQQIDSPELNAALRRLQEAMKQLSPDQIRQAMQQLTLSEESLRKSIERTVSLLKRIQVEQKFDEAIRRTEELRQRQSDIQRQSSQSTDADEMKQLAERQEDAKKEYQKLREQLSDLQKRMEEFPDEMPLREYSEATDFIDKQDVDAQMQRSLEDLQQGRMQQSQAPQQRAEGALQEFGKQLQQTKDAMQRKMQQQMLAGFRRAMEELLTMSEKEEALKNESRALDPSSQRFRENAQQQMDLAEDLGRLANSLGEMSQKTFAVTPKMGKSIGQAYGNMTSAIQALEDRNGQQASENQKNAMGSLNDATRQIQQSIESAMQGGQGGLGSLLEQLARMAAQQQGINGQTMDLGGLNGLTPEQAAQAARLAAEQAALQKSLDQLNQEARESAERQKLLGDLDRVSGEMKEVVKDLEQQNVNQTTIQRQERILSRLLDAQRSMRERDYENRRRAEAGKEIPEASPAELDPSVVAGTSRLMQDLQKAMEQGYAKEYQDLIRKYFEALQKNQ